MTFKAPLLTLLLPLSLLLSFTFTQAGQCGRLDTCDMLVTSSIFETGACGRAARCYWELMHFEKYLLANTKNVVTYENLIKTALCSIPDYKLYIKEVFNQEMKVGTFRPCGQNPGSSYSNKPEEEFGHFPINNLYTFKDRSRALVYLKQVENCRQQESKCTEALNRTIVSMCETLTLEQINNVEEGMQVKLRGKRAYEFIYGKNNIKQEELTAGNKCLLRFLTRERNPPDDQNGFSKFSDTYDVYKAPNRYQHYKEIHQLRPPLFDLYILYRADALGNFAKAPEEERWWNETKAFQELAHYLKYETIEHVNKAIKCVYDKVSSDLMQWKPDKFCWSTSTFVCVQLNKLKGTDCSKVKVGEVTPLVY